MLKHENIVSLLTTAQKVRMLCDISCLSEREYRVLGIPEIKIGNMEDNFGKEFPSPYMLANSWNRALVGDVAGRIAKDMSRRGETLAVTPGAKVKISPYRTALSEDVLLGSCFASEYIAAAKSVGLSSCAKGFSVAADEAEWMDETPKSRVIYEYIVRPYRLAAEKCGFVGAVVAPDIQTPGYESVNKILANVATESETCAFAVCEKANMQNTVNMIMNGVVCFEGVPVALEAALNKYKQMKKSVDKELIPAKDLEEEVLKGNAISKEMLDAAVDRVISFAFACERKRILSASSETERGALALKAARESAVLLKNENKILPLKKKANFCVIGDIAISGENAGFAESFSEYLKKYGYTSLGLERGYDIARDRSDEMIKPALDLAEKADVVFLFIGFDKARDKRIHKTQKLSIPANQQVLFESLDNSKSKIIAVVSCDCAADIALPAKANALILAPINTESSAQALAQIVCGEYSPSGKLANSMYLNTDELLPKQRVYKKRDGVKSGPFIGYRYYDTAEYNAGFAFGHGLSYSEFTYSKLAVKDGNVTVTVKNTGKMAASETVQVYIGMENSAVIRPKKELMAFEKAELAPGEKRTFSFALELPRVFDAETKGFLAERGTYKIYVGSSVTDIRLVCEVKSGESVLKPDGEIKSNYLQSESNIIKDNYKLEADCDIMKKSTFNIIAGIAALILAVFLKAYCQLANTNAMFFDILAAILAVAGWIFFIAEAVYRKKDSKTDEENIEEANAEAFAEAESVEIADADRLFTQEFDVHEEEETAINAIEDYSEGFGAEHLIYVDQELDFRSAARDFIESAKEKGFEFKEKEAAKIFSAMASSRILMFKGMSEEDFKNLMVILGNYFESAVYIDSADESYVSPESLLFKNDAAGNRSKTSMKLALESAYNLKEKVHFAAITGVTAENLASYISPAVKYAKNPTVYSFFTAHNERNTEMSFSFPQNVWIVLNIAEGESLSALPASVAEIASVNSVFFKECPASEVHANIRKFSYYQMEYLCEKLSSRFTVDEAAWKKVDRLEGFVAARAKYKIGNKLWLCLEKYAETLLDCGATQAEALDEAMAAKLLPSMIAVLEGKLSGEETSLAETLEAIFGEDNVASCVRAVKTSGADVT